METPPIRGMVMKIRTTADLFQDVDTLISMVSSVTGATTAETARALASENAILGSTVWKELKARNIRPYQWSEDLIGFYQGTTAFVFETLVWNRCELKQQMQDRIVQYLRTRFGRPCRVLVYGDGLGFDSAALALAGHDVTYFEVSQKAIQFAKQLFAQLGCSVRMLTHEDLLHEELYDAVVCLDVLEHVPNPIEMVGSLAKSIGNDGYLLIHAPFWYLAPSVATHLASNRRFSGNITRIYKPNGLRAIDGALFWDPIALVKNDSKVRPKLMDRFKLAIGGCLLSVGRYWSTPHVILCQMLMKRSRLNWPELDRFVTQSQ